MKSSMFSVTLGTLMLLSATGASAQGSSGLPAQLPAAVVSAKKIFIANSGNSPITYHAFCDGIRDWGKYEIVASSDGADLIVELSYREADKGTASWSAGNAFASTEPRREKKLDPQVIVTIYDGKTNEPLWSATDYQKRAKREKNREKEAIRSVQHLISDLERGAGTPESI
jgi:hypothetical protein